MGSAHRLIAYGLAALAVIALLSTWQHRSAQLTASRGALEICAGDFAELSTHSKEQQRIIDALRMQVELQAK